MGNARPVTAVAVSEVQALGAALSRAIHDGEVTTFEAADIRRHLRRVEMAVKFADSRLRLIRHLTGDVQDVANTDKRFALAGVPVQLLTDPDEAA